MSGLDLEAIESRCEIWRAMGVATLTDDVTALVAEVRRLGGLLAEVEPVLRQLVEAETAAPVLCACSGSATPGAVPLCLVPVERAGDVCVGCRQVCQGSA